MKLKYASLLLLVPALLLAACAQPVRPTEQDEEPVKEVKLPDVNLTGDLLYDIMLGEIAGRRGDFQVSVLALTRAAEKSRDPRLAERATKAAIYAKQYGLGLKAAKLWVQLSPEDSDALQSLAALYLYRDEPVQAQLYFEKVLKIAEAEKRLGLVYLEITGIMSRYKQRDATMEVMQTLAALYPKSPEGQYSLAHLGLRSGHMKEGLSAINRALELRPHWDDAALLKSQILIASNAGPGVEKFYRGYLDSNPKATRVRLSFARYLVDLKRWEVARTEFGKVVESEPEDTETLYALALLSLQTGHLEEADAQFRRVVRLNPHHEQARLYLGQVAEKRKRYSEAFAWYSGITTPPNRFEAQIRLGIVLAAQGKLAEARAHLANTKPKGEQQMVQRALAEDQILRDAKQFREALNVLSKVLKKLPQNNDLLYARALVAERLDDLVLHERDLRKILKSDPKNAHALNALGYSLADHTTRYKEALALIQQAMELRPNDAFILDSMGWVQYRMGNHEEAVRYLKQALAIRNDPEISAHLGEVLWVMGDRQAAEDVWRRALKTTPDSEPLLDIIKKFKP